MNDSRKLIIRASVIFVGIIFLLKLMSIQVLSDNYRLAAENNIIQRIIGKLFLIIQQVMLLAMWSGLSLLVRIQQ